MNEKYVCNSHLSNFTLDIQKIFTSRILSPCLSPAASAGEASSTLPTYWPMRPFSACRLKPKPSKSGHFWMWQSRGAGTSSSDAIPIVHSLCCSAVRRRRPIFEFSTELFYQPQSRTPAHSTLNLVRPCLSLRSTFD